MGQIFQYGKNYSVNMPLKDSLEADDYAVTGKAVSAAMEKKVDTEGGTITGDLTIEGTLTADLEGNAATATADEDGNNIKETYLPKEELINLIYPVGSIYMSANNVSPQTFLGGTWEQIKDKFLLSAGDSYAAGSTGGSANLIIPYHNHTFTGSSVTSGSESSHTHSVGAHSHGLNNHTHSVGAHSHGLNSHTHSIPGLSGTASSEGGHTHTARGDFNTSWDGSNNGRLCKSANIISTDTQRTTTEKSGAHTHGVTTVANTSGKSSGSTANSTAFNTGGNSGSTANSGAFNSGAGSAHSHSVTAAGTISYAGTNGNTTGANLPPYLTVYIWKRTN